MFEGPKQPAGGESEFVRLDQQKVHLVPMGLNEL
jgi:hypothetical protein